MRILVGAALLASMTLGAVPSSAQTTSAMTGGMGSVSPLGAGFGNVGISESAAGSSAGVANQAPCAAGNNPGKPALPTFDGGGLGLADSGSMSTPTQTSSMATNASSSCNAVTTSGIDASSLSPSVPVSNPASTSDGPGSVAGLGTSSLGTSGLGTTSLGALPILSASESQATSASTGVSSSPTSCAGGSNGSTIDTSVPTSMTNAAAAQSDSGVVRDLAMGVGSGLRNPAQTLAGEATLPTTSAAGAPCTVDE